MENSAVTLKDSIREWYALKSLEFSSSNYDILEREAQRLCVLENRIENLRSQFIINSRNLRSELFHQLNSFQPVNTNNDEDETPVQQPNLNNIYRLALENRRFEPTAELKLEDIFSTKISYPTDEAAFKNVEIVNDNLIDVASFANIEIKDDVTSNNSISAQNSENKNASTIVNEECIKNFNDKDCNQNGFGKWIFFYQKFYEKLSKNLEEIESDVSQKKRRFALKAAVIDKINFSAKKKAENIDLAKTLNFFFDLIDNKPIKDMDGNNFQLMSEDTSLMNYAMYTIVSRYIEQIKWDKDLMDTVVLIIISICLKSKLFYKIFCATILNSSVFLKMSISEILDKIISFMSSPPEAAVLWIQSERSIFRLFNRVQLSLKSEVSKQDVVDNIAQLHNLEGPSLLVKLLVDTFNLDSPINCASPFIVGDLFNNCFKNLLSSKNKSNGGDDGAAAIIKNEWSVLAERINWQPIIALISSKLIAENLINILYTRNDALVCSLKHNIMKIRNN